MRYRIEGEGRHGARAETGFGKDVCEISGPQGVVPELKETLTYPHFDFGNSFCTNFHDFTALFTFLTVIRIAVQQG